VTITSIIRCDFCGKTESYPLDRVDKRDWFHYLPTEETDGPQPLDRPMHHCCSIACWVKNRRLRG
jgi:hypothetical protein